MRVLFLGIVALGLLCSQGYTLESCPVGESDVGVGACNVVYGETKCGKYCIETYGQEFVISECRGGGGRPVNARECICHLRCAMAEYWGDPHYRSFDGLPFDFDGECEHVGLESDNGPMSPRFRVLMENKHLNSGWPSIPQMLKVVVIDWGVSFAFDMGTLKMKVNNEEIKPPYNFVRVADFREEFLMAGVENGVYSIRSSFGLHIEFKIQPSHRNAYISLARSPAFVGKIRGAFGNLDGNRTNDFIDKHGLQRYPAISADANAFGQSWCLLGSQLPRADENRTDILLAYEQHMSQCKQNKRSRLEALCHGQLKAESLKCLSASDMEAAMSACIVDVCNASPTKDRPWDDADAACGVIQAQMKICGFEGVSDCLEK